MKKLVILLSVTIVIIIGIFYFRGDSTEQNTNTNNTSSVTQSNETPPSNAFSPQTIDPNLKYYTMEEVRKHGPETWNTGDSSLPCWMVIHDKVYEIPDSFTETHPGGHVIYDGCGTDATEFFETRPQGSGTPHSANARQILEKYYIGELKK